MATKASSQAEPPAYAELQVTTNFSFLRGGSHGEELVARAKALGLAAIAVADRNTLAGVVRAHAAAKAAGIKLIVGARLDLMDGLSLLCLPTDRAAYGRLSALLSLGQLRAQKGECELYLDDVSAHSEGNIFIALAPDDWDWRATQKPSSIETTCFVPNHINKLAARTSPSPRSSRGEGRGEGQRKPPTSAVNRLVHQPQPPCRVAAPHPNPLPIRLTPMGRGDNKPAIFEDALSRIKAVLGTAPLYLAAHNLYRGDDRARLDVLAALAVECGTPLVATNDVHYHSPERRALQDVLSCIRLKCAIHNAGFRLAANAERHLKPPQEMAQLFEGHGEALARTMEIADACNFSLDELVYEYPDEPVPHGKDPQSHLKDLTWAGAAWRFPDGLPAKVKATLTKELALIDELGYAPYFLTVHDIVSFARSRGILCQGRGSAANSAVCYCLAITAVNPIEIDLLFERFISPERREPPDIDVDFEHERREEVIQYIYARFGRDKAALAATVISYRARSAVRDVGKVMGLSADVVAALAGMVWGSRSGGALPEQHVREAGLDPADPLLSMVLALTQELIGFPRHLSQHVGGFVLTKGPLCEVVPVGNAAMEDRTVIEWDKDDLDTLGLLKVDILALGMLSCIRKAFDLLARHHDRPMTLAQVPREDPAVYDMLCAADSLGVFQVESRAQMNMLPRLKPRVFYDLVIEVAIVRPGPIQGDMVHPYLRRRDGLEPEIYPSPAPEHGPADELEQILGKTKGVPLFQEQAMRIAMVAAKFSGAEANELRKAMATFRRRGSIGDLEDKMVGRMVARGYTRDFATRCFNQIKGFGDYGFPESHAASFAHLVYVSSWLKCHYPAVFACALLNSQPMGFYAPAQIVRDAREHEVDVREVDVNLSDWDCTLEPGGTNRGDGDKGPALRLGMRLVDGLRKADVEKILAARSSALTGCSARFDRALGTSLPYGARGPCASAAQRAGSPSLSVVACGKEGTALRSSPSPRRASSALRGEGRGEGQLQERMREGQLQTPEQAAAPHPSPLPMKNGERGPDRVLPQDRAGSQPREQGDPGRWPAPAEGQGASAPDAASERKRTDIHDLWSRAAVSPAVLEKLAAADAFRSMGLDRRQALWQLRGIKSAEPLPLFQWSDTREAGAEPDVALPKMPLSEHVINDYQTLRLSLKAHPLSFLRQQLGLRKVVTCADLRGMQDGQWVAVSGLVLIRQRPGTAKGVVFMTIEDETGVANVVIWSKTLEKFRRVVMGSRLIEVHGRIQRHEDIIHVVSSRLLDNSQWLLQLSEAAADSGSRLVKTNAARGHPRNMRIVPKSRDFH